MNSIKTVLLLGLMSGVLLAGGQALGGQRGLTMALFMAIAMNFLSYFFSEKIAIMSSGAQRVSETEHPQVYHRIAPMVKRLCERMKLPMPKLWVIPESAPNAFATGRNPSHSSVAVTVGLLELMDDREVEAVIAHELGHILNRDILISSIAATLGAAITFLGRMAFWFGGSRSSDEEEGGGSMVGGLVMMIVAPIAAMVIQMAISRTREYGADAAAAKYTGDPSSMISALRRLEGYSKRIPMDVSPAQAHMYIIQPFSGEALMRLFSTHPATEQRIARLQQLQVR
ncbi:MAG: zinc metalloprotease HtpX [Bryobacterales bacterium]|nr:zinc metalloprotease HtpX [Bryobacterales bacterium]